MLSLDIPFVKLELWCFSTKNCVFLVLHLSKVAPFVSTLNTTLFVLHGHVCVSVFVAGLSKATRWRSYHSTSLLNVQNAFMLMRLMYNWEDSWWVICQIIGSLWCDCKQIFHNHLHSLTLYQYSETVSVKLYGNCELSVTYTLVTWST